MRHPGKHFAPVVFALVLSLVIAAPARAGVGLSYFELAQGTSPSEVVVAWTTETEIGTAAFVIKRATEPDLAQALTIHVEPARGSAISGFDYRYTDTNLTPGQEYYYWLIDLTTLGSLITLGVRQIVAGGTPPHEPRIFLPLMPIATTSHRDSAR